MTAGRISLLAVLALAGYGAVASVAGARRGRPEWVESARRSVYAMAALTLLAAVIIELAYWQDDFDFRLVASNSSTTTPVFYKLTSLWSSQEGSLLLWLLILTSTASVALRTGRERCREIAPYAISVLCVVAGFFALLVVVYADPFAASAPGQIEGAGLQPLLRYPLMALHPVALYLGYAGFAVPFAFAIGALITRRLDPGWLVAVRRYALSAWAFLALGLILGSRWSYAELGWGGYWGWDPVENAALLPWLTATAFLHSSVVQEKRGLLKIWNVGLIIGSFSLALVGTFLVRSGILDSIHAFGASTLGIPFLVFIGLVVFGSAALLILRLPDLRTTGRLESLASREAAFLLNNLLLVSLAFVIFWGTFFPLISEALTGRKASVGPPWFDRYTTPAAILLVLLSGAGPLLAWGRTTPARLIGLLRVPAAAALATLASLLVLSDAAERPAALLTFTFAVFAISAAVQELWRGLRARSRTTGERGLAALAGLMRRNRRRYGGYVVHVGVAILLLGVAASSSFATQRDVRLLPGQRARIAHYTVSYDRPTSALSNEKITFGAVLRVSRDGRPVAVLRPSREYYPSQDLQGLGAFGRFFDGEATSEIGLRAGLAKDVWVSVQPDVTSLRAPIDSANRRFATVPARVQAVIIAAIVRRYEVVRPPATFRLIVRTGVSWMWLGAAIVGLGALVAVWPGRPRRLRTRGSATETDGPVLEPGSRRQPAPVGSAL